MGINERGIGIMSYLIIDDNGCYTKLDEEKVKKLCEQTYEIAKPYLIRIIKNSAKKLIKLYHSSTKATRKHIKKEGN